MSTRFLRFPLKESTDLHEIFRKAKDETSQDKLRRLHNNADMLTSFANSKIAHPDAGKYHEDKEAGKDVDKYEDPEEVRGRHESARDANVSLAKAALEHGDFHLAAKHSKIAGDHHEEAKRITRECRW